MRKGIYIRGGSKKEFAGVTNKISNQIKFFSKYYAVQEIIIEKEKTNLCKSILWRLPGGSWGAQYDDAAREIAVSAGNDAVFFFYIRVSPIDRKYVRFLKMLRASYPSSKILLEIPTYPYDREYFSSKTMWPWYFKDKFNRRYISNYIDRVVLFNDTKSVFGVPAIKAYNGIDVVSTKPILNSNEDPGIIRLIVVAMMQPYHGYERLLKGMASYYRDPEDRDIELIMVGYGTELEYYKRLAHDLKLEDRVIFKGKLEGDDLDKAYEACDLAVGSLGGYKIGVNRFASIKLGEYLAKGLPVITGAPTNVFEEYGNEYNLEFPNDSSEIDIEKVIEFHDSVYSGRDKGDVREEIREFAINTIDISASMKNVTDYLES